MTGRDEQLCDLAVRLGRTLPAEDVRRLVGALRAPGRLLSLQAEAGTPVRAACADLNRAGLTDTESHLVAGVLLGVIAPDPAACSVEPVWTGPATNRAEGRLTSAVVVDLIDSAAEAVLIVGYAVHSEPTVTAALSRVRARGVSVRLVLERAADNPSFAGGGVPFPDLAAERLCWPASSRPQGASLHAKILVIDERAALVGSANITGAALGKNLECGLLIRGGDAPRALRARIQVLLDRGELAPLP